MQFNNQTILIIMVILLFVFFIAMNYGFTCSREQFSGSTVTDIYIGDNAYAENPYEGSYHIKGGYADRHVPLEYVSADVPYVGANELQDRCENIYN